MPTFPLTAGNQVFRVQGSRVHPTYSALPTHHSCVRVCACVCACALVRVVYAKAINSNAPTGSSRPTLQTENPRP